jgi:glucoamylase
MYVTGTPVAREHGVDGYYVRVAQPDQADAASPINGFVPIKNRPPDDSLTPAIAMVSPDALALVRFGLRAPDDPRVVATVKVIDALLKVATPNGPAWRRYNGDGYGEHEDGRPFDGTGVGRAWPLLSGERAHYEIAAGRMTAAEDLARALEAFAGSSGLLPEQVWDAPDVPERELFAGQATGSARPLVWAQAEYLKLRRSLRDGRIFDQPRQTGARYIADGRSDPPHVSWRFNNKTRTMRGGKTLRFELLEPARIHWTKDGWQRAQDADTTDTGLGVHVADLATSELAPGSHVDFTFYWPAVGRWEGVDFRVSVDAPSGQPA